MRFRLTGATEMERNLRRIAKEIAEQAASAVAAEAAVLLKEAQRRVPIDTGELKDSGRVDTTRKGNSTRVEISFSAPHAVHVHENLAAHHAEGQAKFLESAMDESESQIIRAIGKRINLKKAAR